MPSKNIYDNRKPLANRSVIVITPRQLYVDWWDRLIPPYHPENTSEGEHAPWIFLVDELEMCGEEKQQIEDFIQTNYLDLFRILIDNQGHQENWPDFTVDNFKSWFEVHIQYEPWDIGKGRISTNWKDSKVMNRFLEDSENQ